MPNKINGDFAAFVFWSRVAIENRASKSFMTMRCQNQSISMTMAKRSVPLVCAVVLALAAKPALAGCGGALLTTPTNTVQFVELSNTADSTSRSAAQAVAQLVATKRAANAGQLQNSFTLADAGNSWQGPFSPLEAFTADSSWQGPVVSLASDSSTITSLDAASLLTAQSGAQIAGAAVAVSIQTVPEPGTAMLAGLTLTIALLGYRASRRSLASPPNRLAFHR